MHCGCNCPHLNVSAHGVSRIPGTTKCMKCLGARQVERGIHSPFKSKLLQRLQSLFRFVSPCLCDSQTQQRTRIVGLQHLTRGQKHRRFVWQAVMKVDEAEQIHQLYQVRRETMVLPCVGQV